jgi:hypothetical protein
MVLHLYKRLQTPNLTKKIQRLLELLLVHSIGHSVKKHTCLKLTLQSDTENTLKESFDTQQRQNTRQTYLFVEYIF